jgi:hypothetical protein
MITMTPLFVLRIRVIGLTAIAAILFSTNVVAVAGPTRTFQSTGDDAFRVQIPEDWIIHDIDNTDSTMLELESSQGYGLLATLCPERQQQESEAALSNVGGSGDTASCQGSDGNIIHIVRYPDLETTLGTTDNILTYHLQKLQEIGYNNIEVVNSTDRTVNIENPQTNQTIATVPAKFVEITYTSVSAPNETRRGYFILTSTDATLPNEGTTKGYSVFYEGGSSTSTTLSPAVGQIFDSFELIGASEAAATLTPTTPVPAEGENNESSSIRSSIYNYLDGIGISRFNPNDPDGDGEEDRPDYRFLTSMLAASRPTPVQQIQAAETNTDIDARVIRDSAKESLGDLVLFRTYLAMGDTEAADFHVQKIITQMTDIVMEVGFTRPIEQMIVFESEVPEEDDDESNSGEIISELEEQEQEAIEEARSEQQQPNPTSTVLNASEIKELALDVSEKLGFIVGAEISGTPDEVTLYAKQMADILLEIYYNKTNFSVPLEQVQVIGSTEPSIEQLRSSQF